jgi:hypothetical protein
MKYIDFKLKTKRWNQFSAVDTLGAFDFYTTIVSFEAIGGRDLQNLHENFDGVVPKIELKENGLTPKQYEIASKILPLAAHEYTHFFDSTSTIWGMRHLKLMNNAYSSNYERGGAENEFYEAKRFYDHIRSIRLPEYYTVVNEKEDARRPWHPTITMGKVFNAGGTSSARPVLFSNFTNLGGAHLARSPISAVSILEASAMAQELYVNAMLLRSTTDPFRTVEIARYNDEMTAYLHNPKITEYSVCFHVLANILDSVEGSEVVPLCGALTRVVLNCPERVFKKLQRSCPISKILNIQPNTEFEKRLRDGLAHRDLGILYYLICRALPLRTLKDGMNISEIIEICLAKLGVSVNEFMREGESEINTIESSLKKSQYSSIRELTSAGMENFKHVPLDNYHLDFGSLHFPPAYLVDSTSATIFQNSNNRLAEFDLERCFEELFEGQSWVERFAEACL